MALQLQYRPSEAPSRCSAQMATLPSQPAPRQPCSHWTLLLADVCGGAPQSAFLLFRFHDVSSGDCWEVGDRVPGHQHVCPHHRTSRLWRRRARVIPPRPRHRGPHAGRHWQARLRLARWGHRYDCRCAPAALHVVIGARPPVDATWPGGRGLTACSNCEGDIHSKNSNFPDPDHTGSNATLNATARKDSGDHAGVTSPWLADRIM